MKPELIEKVRGALDGWLEGDVTPLADLLDSEVELLWWRSGDWDIRGKKDVLAVVKQRAAQRPPGVTIDVSEVGTMRSSSRAWTPRARVRSPMSLVGSPDRFTQGRSRQESSISSLSTESD